MIDVKLIRENIELVEENLRKRRSKVSLDKLKALEHERLDLLKEVEQDRAKKNESSKKIGEYMKAGNKEEAEKIKEEMKNFTESLNKKEEKLSQLEEAVNNEILYLPNMLSEDVPDGDDEKANKEIIRWGEPRKFDFEVKDHVDIAMGLDILDIERAVRMSRTRFSLMKGKGAALERALINFMLKKHTSEHGYTEYVPPILVNGRTMTGTGQLPKFEEDLFKTTDDPALYLIPTAEVPLTNIYREEIIPENMLPLYCTAYTPCFRSEAGSYGRDMRGLIRQHQFDKVELVKICAADKSKEEHEKMLKDAESILQALELPYRVVVLSSGDIGNAAYKTFDIEVWLPSQNMYREISSVSNCWDYQARRMQMRTRRNGKTELVHTLNGSGIAVGRTWIAILENYQQADGSVIIPDALRPFTGFDKIEKPN
ncbi:serine--tRNA ligase [Brachyspira hyodysenteriae]|uniref:Serine--tRNA ligase n=1 Tax=Brachyspira hyodysenteriae (strain ATCC 49526 / WA1) TaxID=565034 RepID=SYS_BRAHW|nr:serine--tRNA ligase [Brachyspira hyodysenteriae]C0R1U9.1 RecName: Full=Serine--tRNA ligase; AltName: Full=Seryl-tRNA synthetase; Short=SerRS; AltName: Full=Seryl-tRNA(Ser/Sec) synthetase [Brachyspira hyodysenteriae WA1]ACN84087.1 seryl-tRNA synthetase [Brachyspira hyodysenteriae WA1]AUJ49817.1 serine--tRNA ligase [Brachyspira hyodysenteriae]KLI20588.1 serine--tRNA ligase [Brachyspira hyodysenteriae]KLI25192.1 serine--tRNA ligase [Brachyspira hyodysenteriae]KLI35269.1 serine--tRNA ligase [B